MRKLLASSVFIVMVVLWASAAVAQAVEDPPLGPEPKQYALEVDDPRGIRIAAKYPYQSGPEDPDTSPWVIQEPMQAERGGSNINTSLATSQGLNTGGPSVSPSVMTGPGAILSAPRGSGSARSSHQDARRGLKKVIRQLG